MRRRGWLLLAVVVSGMGACHGGDAVAWLDPCDGACAAGEVCWAGTCQPDSACSAPHAACAYSDGAMGCTDLRDDPFNCGGCGLRCVGGVCQEGVCRAASNTCAGAGLADCVDAFGHSYCAYLDGEPLDCGACGNACDVAAGEFCAAGACRAAGTTCDELGLASCPTQCADLQNDPYNCGTCGNVCMFGCDGLGACR
jgi:hypothetical protein